MALIAGATRRTWRGEALLGVTLAAMSAPVAMAFAQFSGLPPAHGLYALIVPGLLFALFASTGRLTAAPDSALIALVAATLTPLARPGSDHYIALCAAQALVAGLVYAVIALLRLSVIAVLLPRPVLLGFTSAIALDFLVRELAAMFGIRLGRRMTDAAATDFLQHAGTFITHLGDADVHALAVAAGALAILLIGRRISRRLPWELAVYLAGFAAYRVFGLGATGMRTVGGVDAGRLTFAWPDLNGSSWFALVPGAFTLVFVAIAQHQDDDPAHLTVSRRDGVVYGATNAMSGLTGGLAMGPSPARRARLDEARAVSQLPTFVAALLVLAALLFGGTFLGDLPVPALGAIAAMATWPLLRLGALGELWRNAKGEFALALLAFAATLVFGTLIGLAVAAGLGLLRLIRAAAAPPIDVVDGDGRPIASLRPGAPPPRATAPGIVIVRPAAPVDAVTAGALARGIRAAVIAEGDSVRHLVLDCEAITGVDSTGAGVMRAVFGEVTARGVTVDFSRARAVLRVEFEQHGLLGGSRVFRTDREALDELA